MNVIDFATKKPLSEAAFQMRASELAAFAKTDDGPDFVKKHEQMVITPETKDQTDQLFKVFALGIRSDGNPNRQINTWGWLAAQVSTSLNRYARGEDFDILVRPYEPPLSWTTSWWLSRTAIRPPQVKQPGVSDAYDGLESGHPQAKLLDL
jgi:hypothetical protein